MTYETILALMLSLAPRTPEARARPLAEAIAHAAQSPEDAATLVVLSFYETGFGRGGAPFGVTHHRGRRLTLDDAAARALVVLGRGAEVCGPGLARRLGFFRTGRCGIDATAQRQAGVVRRLVARAGHATQL